MLVHQRHTQIGPASISPRAVFTCRARSADAPRRRPSRCSGGLACTGRVSNYWQVGTTDAASVRHRDQCQQLHAPRQWPTYPSTDRHGFWLSTAPARISPPAVTPTVTRVAAIARGRAASTARRCTRRTTTTPATPEISAPTASTAARRRPPAGLPGHRGGVFGSRRRRTGRNASSASTGSRARPPISPTRYGVFDAKVSVTGPCGARGQHPALLPAVDGHRRQLRAVGAVRDPAGVDALGHHQHPRAADGGDVDLAVVALHVRSRGNRCRRARWSIRGQRAGQLDAVGDERRARG